MDGGLLEDASSETIATPADTHHEPDDGDVAEAAPDGDATAADDVPDASGDDDADDAMVDTADADKEVGEADTADTDGGDVASDTGADAEVDGCGAIDAVVTCGTVLTGLSAGEALFDTYSCAGPTSDYSGSGEVVHSFYATFDLVVTVSSPTTGAHVAVLQDNGEGCVDSGDNCVGVGSGGLTFTAAAGATYYLVWDGQGPSELDDLDIEVSCCIPT